MSKKIVYTTVDGDGNLRVGSTEQQYIRESHHKGQGRLFIDTSEHETKRDMLDVEYAKTRFYCNQSTEEEFEVTNARNRGRN
jgi:hypothetical protein